MAFLIHRKHVDILKAWLRRQARLHRALKRSQRLAVEILPRLVLGLLRDLLPSSWSLSLPRGTFSALSLLQDSTAGSTGRTVLLDQGRPASDPYSVMVRSGLQQHACQPWPVFWSRHQKARLVGSSLALRLANRLCAESVYGESRCKDDPAYWHLPFSRPLQLSGAWTSVVSRWVPTHTVTNYAHWLFDALPRLAVLSDFHRDTRIIVPGTLTRFQTESLELLGLGDRIRPTRERHIVVDNYYFSSPSAMIVCYDPYGVAFLRRSFLPHASSRSDGPLRLFIQRQGPFRSAVNEAELEDHFRRRGWQVVDPAQFSFREQIGLFMSAEAVCGVHGAGFANCVWCRPSTKVIELFAATYLSGCYEWLCQVVGADYRHLIFPSDENLCAQVDLGRVKPLLDHLNL